ncbi:phospholipid-transporting ATPase 2-like isoform 1 [Planoprotostelium fungivorum]|uniref:Phospholipid-transporting ATPase n=1 Tax=Planoprotostelium fungivorum TaxID=1890364 RepID=A0A2P6MQV9_9EUKA|nr:phospholipid-transporting ATPase 2-like isoform 1 [Planoprotostelium fungivorum]
MGCLRCLLFWQKDPTDYTRKVYINQPHLNEGHVNNEVTNTKYTILNFLPKNLWEQFGRFMNMYFLLIALLQLKGDITPVNPAATWIPLLVIFSITALKEAVDDYKRYTRDKSVNRRIIQVLRNGQFVPVRVYGRTEKCDQEIPCDIVVLSSSEKDGSCYIQTSNLDGETDLKSRQAVPETRNMLDGTTLSQFMGMIECARPNAEIYRFDSRMKMNSYEEYYSVSLSEKQLLLQATYLRNTDHVVGVAVYTGNETKISMNRTQPPIKWTRVDRLINRLTIFIFVFQFTLVAVFGIAGSMWSGNQGTEHRYLQLSKNTLEEWVYPTLRYLLLCSLMIPISLKVTLDVIKYTYAKFIDWDEGMYDAESDTYAVAASTSISEDLGQIEYIFSDKTGTLTENIMSLKRVTVKDQVYGEQCHTISEDEALKAKIADNDLYSIDLFRILSLCHSVIIARGTEMGDHGHFKASSPDEEALVKAAAEMKIEFIHSDTNNIEIMVNGRKETYERLYVLEFTSERKRMSVILRDRSNGRIRLLCKGADEAILPRLYSKDHMDSVQNELEKFAKEGLRTLCVAEREITPEVFEKWIAIFNQANTSMDARAQKLAEVYESIERELTLVGTTAIEDKLQEQVPETIAALRNANIRVWMLTGDKYSTAIQIATSCNLISQSPLDGELISIRGETEMEAVQSLGEAYLRAQELEAEGREISVIIEGKTLAFLSDYPKFCQIGLIAHTVICCRMTPQQKAKVVAMIKEKDKRTLSIGDGGNDVSMIYEAHIGVGITGREGMQASRAADYSISKFHHLRRLVLLHGRWSYIRTSFVAQYCFYKSMFICFIQLVYGFFNGFSAQTFFNSFFLTGHNIVFTGIPIILYVLDRDLPANLILSRPSLYREVQSGSKFSAASFMRWVIRALFQSLVCWSICAQAFYNIQADGHGDSGLNPLSMTVYTSLIIVNTLTIVFESSTLTLANHFILWGTLLLYALSILFLGFVFPSFSLYGVFPELCRDSRFYLSVLLSVAIALLPPEIIKVWTKPNRIMSTTPQKSEYSISISMHDTTGGYFVDSPLLSSSAYSDVEGGFYGSQQMPFEKTGRSILFMHKESLYCPNILSSPETLNQYFSNHHQDLRGYFQHGQCRNLLRCLQESYVHRSILHLVSITVLLHIGSTVWPNTKHLWPSWLRRRLKAAVPSGAWVQSSYTIRQRWNTTGIPCEAGELWRYDTKYFRPSQLVHYRLCTHSLPNTSYSPLLLHLFHAESIEPVGLLSTDPPLLCSSWLKEEDGSPDPATHKDNSMNDDRRDRLCECWRGMWALLSDEYIAKLLMQDAAKFNSNFSRLGSGSKPIGTMKIALTVFLLTVSIAVIQAAECSNAGLPNNLLQYQADLWDLRAKICNNGCNGTCTLWGNERTVDSGKYKARAIVKSLGGSCWGAQQNVIEQCVRNNWIGGSWSWGNEYYSLSFVKTGEIPSPQNNGVVTYYNCESGQQGACGGWIKNSDAEAAVGDSMFKNGAACGKKVRLSGPRGSIDVTIRDSCGWACEYGHFDICQGVFGKIADPNDGLVKIKWSWL